jgi:hypothetical protein
MVCLILFLSLVGGMVLGVALLGVALLGVALLGVALLGVIAFSCNSLSLRCRSWIIGFSSAAAVVALKFDEAMGLLRVCEWDDCSAMFR